MKYLDNEICEFKPLFKITKKKKKIVTGSLFRIKGGGYRKFYKYIDQLTHVNRYVNEVMEGFVHRLFIDKSIYTDKKLMSHLKKMKIELVLYTCPDFLVDKKHHQGTFGTLVRFFPMFDFPNNDAEIAWPTDIDFGSYEDVVTWSRLSKLYRVYLIINQKNIWNKIDYIADVDIEKKENNHYHLFAGRQISKGNLDHNIIVNFFKNINDYEGNLTRYGRFNDKLKKSAGKFVYGIDEWFMDYNFYDYIEKENIPYIYAVKLNLSSYLFSTTEKLECWKKGNCLWYDRFFKFIFPDKKFKNTSESIKYLKDILFRIVDSPDSVPDNELILKIYLYLISILDTKEAKYFKEESLHHILSEKYIGKYYSTEIMFKNVSGEDFFLPGKRELRSLPKKDVDYLKNIMGYK